MRFLINNFSRIILLASTLLCLHIAGCSEGDKAKELFQDNPSDDNDLPNKDVYVMPNYSSPIYHPGIPIYTADMAKNRSTEVNSEWVIRNSQYTKVSSEILRNGYNSVQKISFEGFNNDSDYLEFVVAIHGKLVNRVPVPTEFVENINGISFRAVSYSVPVNLTLEVYNLNGDVIRSKNFELTTDDMKLFKMEMVDKSVHHISFKVTGQNQDLSKFSNGALIIDDIYLTNNTNTPFEPPIDDSGLFDWLKRSSINYFLWNYRDAGNGNGAVLEASDENSRVSLSGLGYAYAIYVLAENENIISSQFARERIVSILNWQRGQNWFDGSGGYNGFPLHYFNLDGSGLYQNDPAAISTIDWAICAAGLRVVKQRFSMDDEIVQLCSELLDRPLWQEAIHMNSNDSYRYGRISKGLNAINGEKNGQVWGDAFSEETELVYLEALASGKVSNLDLTKISREKKNGFYVSWFGSGFTYNWMQLWTGAVEPYKANSAAAYNEDLLTCKERFNKPLLGLTACGTFSNSSSGGFLNWNRYIGNQGSYVSGSNINEVIQISPAPYGALLALPFIPSETLDAIRSYLDIGYYHPILGLPDNIRINDLPQGVDVPIPNWNPYDINIGPIAMAIDQYQENIIANYYKNDSAISTSLQSLIESF